MSSPAGGSAPPEEAGRTVALVVYCLYLSALLLLLFPAPVGVVVAYVFRDDGPDWVRAHFRYQIRLFWRALISAVALTAVCVALTVATLGVFYPFAVLIGFVWGLWVLFRIVLGLRAWSLRQPPAGVSTPPSGATPRGAP